MMGIKILNNSWGSHWYSQALFESIEDYGLNDGIFVAAAGNYQDNLEEIPYFPAAYDLDNIISVVASNSSDSIWINSNWGPYSTDLAAPGENIFSTLPNNNYGFMSGTSMATPFIAGAAALVKIVNSTYNVHQIKAQLLGSVDIKPSFLEKSLSNEIIVVSPLSLQGDPPAR